MSSIQREPDPRAKIASAREQMALIRIHLSERPDLPEAEVKRLNDCLSALAVDILVAEDKAPREEKRDYDDSASSSSAALPRWATESPAFKPLRQRDVVFSRDDPPARPLTPLPPYALQQQAIGFIGSKYDPVPGKPSIHDSSNWHVPQQETTALASTLRLFKEGK